MEREKKKQRRVCDSPEKQKTRRIKVIRGLATDWKSIYLKQRSTYITHHSTHTHTQTLKEHVYCVFLVGRRAIYIFLCLLSAAQHQVAKPPFTALHHE